MAKLARDFGGILCYLDHIKRALSSTIHLATGIAAALGSLLRALLAGPAWATPGVGGELSLQHQAGSA